MTTIFQKVDSLEYAEGREVPSHHTARIWWQVDGGDIQSGEIDLTSANLAEYEAPIEKLLKVSDPIPGDRQNRRQPGDPWLAAPGKKSKAVALKPDGTPDMMAGKRRRKEMVAWVDENQITAPDGSGRPAYLSPKGNKTWPRWLDRVYERYLETGEILVPGQREIRASEDMQRSATQSLRRSGLLPGQPGELCKRGQSPDSQTRKPVTSTCAQCSLAGTTRKIPASRPRWKDTGRSPGTSATSKLTPLTKQKQSPST